MTELLCSFLDFRSLTTNYNLHFFLPSKRYHSSVLVHSHISINRIKRKPLHLTLISKPSSELDVISTHEHSDGSLLFRFGDPSEVPKKVEMEESKTVKEETETEVEDDYSVVKVLDGDRETEVMVKRSDEEVGSGLTEVAGNTNSIVISSESPTVVEVESEKLSSMDEIWRIVEKSLEEESKISTVELSEKDIHEVTSTPDVEIESTGNVAEGLKEEHEDSSPSNASIREDQSLEMENGITLLPKPIIAVADKYVSEPQNVEIDMHDETKEEDGEESLGTELTISPSPRSEQATSSSEEAIEEQNLQDDMQNAIIGKDGENSLVVKDVVVDNGNESGISDTKAKSPPMEVTEIVEDGSESDAAELMTASPQLEVQSLVEEETSVETLEDSNPIEAKSTPMVSVEIVEDESGIEAVELMTASSELEVQSLLDEESSVETLEESAAIESKSTPVESAEIVEDRSRSDTVELLTVSPQLEVQSLVDEETSVKTLEESAPIEVNGTESLKVLNNMPHDLVLGQERTEVNDNVQSDDLIQASVYEVTELESTESAIKSQEILVPEFVLSSGAAQLPHPSKALTGGEDAYFIAGQTWVGVADGICQWSLKGTNPGFYAQELLTNCGRLISDCNGNPVNNPVELLDRSVAETHSLGSSTVLIGHIDGQALHVANIGDSGFIVIRHGAVYKRSSPMRHLFHFPLQIERGVDPSSLAEVYKVDLKEGDLIITATDGLLDNLYDQEISSIVLNTLAANKKLAETAETLAMKAQEIGLSESSRSPFADDAQAAGFAGYTGGKLDSVAVIVSLVQRQ